jgi:hypothetical protein
MTDGVSDSLELPRFHGRFAAWGFRPSVDVENRDGERPCWALAVFISSRFGETYAASATDVAGAGAGVRVGVGVGAAVEVGCGVSATTAGAAGEDAAATPVRGAGTRLTEFHASRSLGSFWSVVRTRVFRTRTTLRPVESRTRIAVVAPLERLRLCERSFKEEIIASVAAVSRAMKSNENPAALATAYVVDAQSSAHIFQTVWHGQNARGNFCRSRRIGFT